jgi:hypothetical protein
MSPNYRARRVLSLVSLGIVLLAGCTMGAETDSLVEEDTTEEVDTAPEAPVELVFTLPTSCRDIVPQEALDKLTSGEVGLLRGPGSGSVEGVYLEGQSPQEERGGISCLFGNADETITYTISVAPMTQATRAEVIDGLLAQKLNPGQTLDGGLTYWIQGDQETVPAIYNALYDDAWYEVLIFPGGRLAYEECEALVTMMRSHTTS